MLADRFGPRTVCMTGMACLGLHGAVGIGHRGIGAFGGRQGQLTTAGCHLILFANFIGETTLTAVRTKLRARCLADSSGHVRPIVGSVA